MLPFDLKPASRRALRVLCLGAHADDIEIGCGGTVLELVAARARVHFAVFSGGRRRVQEAAGSAARFLGKNARDRLSMWSFRDGHFPAQYTQIKEAMESLVRLAPDLVFTHYRDDRHQDHRVVSDLAWNTFRDQLILEYEVPKWDGDLGTPNSFVAVPRSTARRKVRHLLAAFPSQRRKDWFDEEVFLGLMRLRGMECRSPSGLAEAFYARKLGWSIG